MTYALREIDASEYDILIVDDNPENLKVLGNFLVDQGFNVRMARDGRQALQSVEAEPPELILLDIHMPVMDGYETCRKLKESEDFNGIPIIFLSALGETFNKVLAFELGGADYISKPFELEEVRVRVGTHLLNSRLLAENRAGFRASFEQAAVGMVHLHLNGCIFAVNHRLCDMLECRAEELAGRFAPDIFPEELGACMAEGLEHLRGGGKGLVSREARTRTSAGSPCWCRVSFSLVTVAPNRSPYIAAILEDITERKQAELDRWRMVAALEQAPDAIAVTDAAGAILYVNRAFEAAHDRAREQLLGRPLALFDVSNEGGGGAPGLRDTVASEGSWNGRTERRRQDGSRVVEEHRVSAARDLDGSLQNYVVVTRDISRQVRLEDQLRQSQKMEAIGTLAAGIAHDFNNLLAAISGFTELALEDLPEGTEVSANLREAAGAASRARELVRQILAFGRQSEFQIRPVHLHDSIQEVLRLLRRTIPPTVDIRSELDASCPPVMADATAIHQILMNLCTNAYHAMEESGGVLDIRLSQTDIDTDQLQGHPDLAPGHYARIEVSDTGHGMDEATRQRIFEPYFTTKEQVGGTGLGLATVHGIVGDLHGALHVYSELGMGSTFSVLLPTASPEDQEMLAPAESPQQGSNEHVLFVDDETAICRFAERALQRLGYRTTTVSDPVKAVELFRETPSEYDVIVTDEMMPAMRGTELLAAVRAISPDTPVILYSGFSGSQRQRVQSEFAFDAHVMKPMVTSELSKAIRSVLHGN